MEVQRNLELETKVRNKGPCSRTYASKRKLHWIWYVERRNLKDHSTRRRCSHVRVFICCLEAGKLLSIGGILSLCFLGREMRLTCCFWKSMESLSEASVKFGYGLYTVSESWWMSQWESGQKHYMHLAESGDPCSLWGPPPLGCPQGIVANHSVRKDLNRWQDGSRRILLQCRSRKMTRRKLLASITKCTITDLLWPSPVLPSQQL